MAKKSKKKRHVISSLPAKYQWPAYSLGAAEQISKRVQRQGGNPEHAELVFSIAQSASTVAGGWRGIALEESKASSALIQAQQAQQSGP